MTTKSEIMDAIFNAASHTFIESERKLYDSLGREWFDNMVCQMVEKLPMALLTLPTGRELDGVLLYEDCIVFDTEYDSRYYYDNAWSNIMPTGNYIYLFLDDDNNSLMPYIKQLMGG